MQRQVTRENDIVSLNKVHHAHEIATSLSDSCLRTTPEPHDHFRFLSWCHRTFGDNHYRTDTSAFVDIFRWLRASAKDRLGERHLQGPISVSPVLNRNWESVIRAPTVLALIVNVYAIPLPINIQSIQSLRASEAETLLLLVLTVP